MKLIRGIAVSLCSFLFASIVSCNKVQDNDSHNNPIYNNMKLDVNMSPSNLGS